MESLLLVHDLHPLDTDTRIRRALGRLGTGAEFLGVDSAGVAHVRLGHGCGSTTAVVEQAITDAAPETTGVEFAPREAPLLQISRRPAGANEGHGSGRADPASASGGPAVARRAAPLRPARFAARRPGRAAERALRAVRRAPIGGEHAHMVDLQQPVDRLRLPGVRAAVHPARRPLQHGARPGAP